MRKSREFANYKILFSRKRNGFEFQSIVNSWLFFEAISDPCGVGWMGVLGFEKCTINRSWFFISSNPKLMIYWCICISSSRIPLLQIALIFMMEKILYLSIYWNVLIFGPPFRRIKKIKQNGQPNTLEFKISGGMMTGKDAFWKDWGSKICENLIKKNMRTFSYHEFYSGTLPPFIW